MHRKHRKKYYLILFLYLLSVLWSISFLEHRLLPPLKEISHMQCRTMANQIIDTAATEILQEMELSDALLLQHQDTEGFTANTVLVNQFCTRFSERITKGLSVLPEEKIRIPLGAATNWSFFANTGPKIPFTLLPMGHAKVDYSSEFYAVGINQVNYKIWLDISAEIKVVNPLYQEYITLERKIMLADVVFSGKVPEHYFQMSSPDEYLLTE